MTRLGPGQIGDLAVQGNIREGCFESVLDALGERGNRFKKDSKRIAARAKRRRRSTSVRQASGPRFNAGSLATQSTAAQGQRTGGRRLIAGHTGITCSLSACLISMESISAL